MQAQHNEQLREALEIAQDANASKTTFLSNMSHDIRTPMNAVIGFSITDKGPSSGAFERIEFQVVDDGYGITEEFQKIIFDPFTRAENSTVNREVGTGLGLAITKDIIDLMGGSIELQSKEGEGSTFIVELPLRVPHEEQDEHFWEHHNVSRILLVDDVASTGESLAALEKLVQHAGGTVCGRATILAEGDAQARDDLIYLEKLPVFDRNGQIKE